MEGANGIFNINNERERATKSIEETAKALNLIEYSGNRLGIDRNWRDDDDANRFFHSMHDRSTMIVNVSRKKDYGVFKISFIWFLYIDNIH